MRAITCCSCGITFEAPDDWVAARRRDGASFSCPNGHSLSWNAVSELTRVKESLQAARGQLLNREADLARLQRSRSALRGVITRMRNAKERGA